MMRPRRLWVALFILALALSMTGFADRSAEAYCQTYTSCEHTCMPREEACLAGTLHPECGGDPNCCYATVSQCYQCCIWY